MTRVAGTRRPTPRLAQGRTPGTAAHETIAVNQGRRRTRRAAGSPPHPVEVGARSPGREPVADVSQRHRLLAARHGEAHQPDDQYDDDGTGRAPSIIVYTPSGYVGVHFPPLNRKPFAGDAPTDEEARAALAGYVGYFGVLAVYPNMVFHQILAGISPLPGNTLKRPLEMKGNEVTIKFPPTRNQQGQDTTTWVTLRRLSGEKEMLR